MIREAPAVANKGKMILCGANLENKEANREVVLTQVSLEY